MAKTTTALNLGVGMARRLHRKGRPTVLLVDLDAQSNATLTMCDGKAPEPPTLTQVLLEQASIIDAIRPSRYPGIDILPADPSLADCTVWLADQVGREQRLSNALAEVEGTYELIIIDSPPAMTLVSINALRAAAGLVVPVDASIYSVMGLRLLEQTIDKVRRHLAHPELAIVTLVLVRAQRDAATRRLERELRDKYGKLVAASVIPYSAHVSLAASHHRTVLEYAPTSPAAKAYDALVVEVLKKHGRKKGNVARAIRSDRPSAA